MQNGIQQATLAAEKPLTIGPFNSLSAAAEAGARDWLIKRVSTAKYAIVNPDIDGLLSFSLLKTINPDLVIGGFYENEHRLLLEDGVVDVFRAERLHGLSSFLSIENDLLFMDSIGQHFCLLDSPKVVRINPNMMRFGSSEKIGIDTYTRNFSKKYPFSTVFFLWVLLGKPLTNGKELIGLLYPDSAILKQFANRYSENVEAWLRWMGVGHIIQRFFELQGGAEIKQLARCLYKDQGSSQFALSFQMHGTTAMIGNLSTAGDIIKFFCGLLSIKCPSLNNAKYVVKSWHFIRFNAEPQQDLRKRKKMFAEQMQINYAKNGRLKSRKEDEEDFTVRVLSEALVTHGEWSVTTHERWLPISTYGIQVDRRVAAGRNAELDIHVNGLGLASPCISTQLGCPFAPTGCAKP